MHREDKMASLQVVSPLLPKKKYENVKINNEVLISEVQKYPALWQLSCKEYKDAAMKRVIWTDIGRALLPLEDNSGK